MAKNTYALTFRGASVRLFASSKTSWASTYDEQYVVLTYRKHIDGSVDVYPTVDAVYKTAATCQKRIKETDRLRQWPGQSFVVGPIQPGVTEIVDAPVVTA